MERKQEWSLFPRGRLIVCPKKRDSTLDQGFLFAFSFLKFKSYKELASGMCQSRRK